MVKRAERARMPHPRSLAGAQILRLRWGRGLLINPAIKVGGVEMCG